MRTFIGVFVFALSYVHAFKRITTKPNIFSIRGGANDVKPSEDSFDILIIGAGLAGLALASGLSANGLKVGILERAKSFERRGGALGVAPNGMRALVELNKVIADKVHKQGFTLDLASMKFATVQDNYTKQEVWAEEFKDDVDLQNVSGDDQFIRIMLLKHIHISICSSPYKKFVAYHFTHIHRMPLFHYRLCISAHM
jgi:hypothetical protein